MNEFPHRINLDDLQRCHEFLEDCLPIFDNAGVKTAVVLKDHGEILFCTSLGERLMGGNRDEIVGRYIGEFILGTRINPIAPGNNVAHANYWGRNNLWKESALRDLSSNESMVNIQLDVIPVDLAFLIAVRIRPIAAHGYSKAETELFPTEYSVTCQSTIPTLR